MSAMAVLIGFLGLLVGMLSLWFTTEAMKRLDRMQGIKAANDPDPKGEIARLETLTRDLERRLGKMEIESRPSRTGSNPASGQAHARDTSFTPSSSRVA